MAVPHVTNIYPAQCHSGGKGLIRLLGGNFAQKLSIKFGGAEARRVIWVNHALAYAIAPISPLQDATTGSGAGLVDVTVQNLDDDDDPVVGEEYTFTDGFTFVMPSFARKSVLERVVLRLREELRRQVWQEVIHRRHADYAPDAAALQVEFSTLPAIALIGPQIVENPVYGRNTNTQLQGEYFVVARQAPLTVDLQFGLVGAWNKDRHGFGLTEATMGFFKKNTKLQVDKDENDPAQGHVLFDMMFVPGNLPVVASAPNESNVSSYGSTVSILGVVLEGFSTVDDIPESDFFDELVGGPPTLELDTSQA
jgi:hypothetical protein